MSAILRTIVFNDLAKRSDLADFVDKMGTGADSADMLAAVVKWFVWLIALVIVVMLVIGGLLASALSNFVRASAARSSQDVKRRRKSSRIGIKKAGKLVARSPRRAILQLTTQKIVRL